MGKTSNCARGLRMKSLYVQQLDQAKEDADKLAAKLDIVLSDEHMFIVQQAFSNGWICKSHEVVCALEYLENQNKTLIKRI